jgi:hypothetical protein
MKTISNRSTCPPTSGFSQKINLPVSIGPCDWTFNLHGAQRVIQSWISEHHTLSHVSDSWKISLTCRPRIKSYDLFYKSTIQTSFWKEMCQKSNIDTTIDFVKIPNTQEITLSWELFRKIIWNRRIITLAVRMIELRRETQDKNVLLKFKISEKIKQVSSTKLTNWYKNISRWKTNKFFHRLTFLGANLKASKILLQSLRASFRNTKNCFPGRS